MRPGVGYSAVGRGFRFSFYQLGTLGSPYRSAPLVESAQWEGVAGPGRITMYERRYGVGTMGSLGEALSFKRWKGPGNEVKSIVAEALRWLYQTERGALGGDSSDRNGEPTETEITDAQATGDPIWGAFLQATALGFSEGNPEHFSDPTKPHGIQRDDRGQLPIDPFWGLPYYRFNDAQHVEPPPPPPPPPVDPPPPPPPQPVPPGPRLSPVDVRVAELITFGREIYQRASRSWPMPTWPMQLYMTAEQMGVLGLILRHAVVCKRILYALAAKLGIVVALALVLAVPAGAVTPPGLVASAWCPVYTSDPQEGDAGCDVGVGLALRLFAHRRIAAVAAVGSKTVGGGAAWIVSRGEHPLAVSLGVIAPYDDRGINVRRWAFALGATFSFKGGE